MGKQPHILAIPYPAQGHVIPLLELSQCLVKHGFKVTFVNTDYNHKRVLNAMAGKDCLADQISLVSIPDGLEPWEDRNELAKLTATMLKFMPGKLEELINTISASEDGKITCVIADTCIGWALDVAEKMHIRKAGFWPAATATFSSLLHLQKLIDDRIISNEGVVLTDQMIQFSPTMPAMKPAHLVWTSIGNLTDQKIAFDIMYKNIKYVKLAEWIIGNSACDLEPGAFTFTPEVLPIGPLLANNRLGNSAGYFWPEDSTCLKWLDQQAPNSVVYVAFGSFTVFDQTQFQELALALELTNRPFLWVVRPDISSEANDAFPEGFKERVANRGQMVGWAPQQKVLQHPAIACFLSHCGWNSTLEGLSNGVPFLCWPYFADQFLDETYICDVWKVGLRFDKDENGIIKREEIKTKVEQLLGDEKFKAKALELKEITMKNVAEGGHSSNNLKNFIEWIKA